ncbi:BQ2448_7734 [Microbotryum intermedium]|uniref:BQ2448_7734 protein n=1 Tax=Microbotryum intermedium TaxID=269621 RepID=A0A238FNF0_9BASI|nr:BQ2448_7734 [Microbotryum intermedium]
MTPARYSPRTQNHATNFAPLYPGIHASTFGAHSLSGILAVVEKVAPSSLPANRPAANDTGPERPTIMSGRAGDMNEDRSEEDSLNAMMRRALTGLEA